ncbi:hypothetical protein AB0H43_20440 [Hamadaea sp. NPDC050747]|uniref:hypothetical protein n=1 Tax=Hamadaea sp. NPDC050747 TaxID=3155789 RepID=UPI003408F838
MEEDLVARVKEGRRRRELADQAGFVRGRHFTEWSNHLDRLRSEGRDSEALPLLFEIIEATERAAAITETGPPPGWTKRAAIILRRLGDRDGEMEVLRRYAAACPLGRGSQALLGRLAKLAGERDARDRSTAAPATGSVGLAP